MKMKLKDGRFGVDKKEVHFLRRELTWDLTSTTVSDAYQPGQC